MLGTAWVRPARRNSSREAPCGWQRRQCGSAPAVLASLFLGWAPAQGAAPYRIVVLDILPDTIESFAFGLNDQGQVVGESRHDRQGHVGQWRPVVWNADGAPHELWAEEHVGASLTDINNVGEVVGRYGSGSGTLPGELGVPYGRAFYWSEATGRINIGFELGGDGQAMAVNDSGQVVGTSEILQYLEFEGETRPYWVPHPYIWESDQGMRDLGNVGGYGGFATAVNSHGQVVGHGDTPEGYERAFAWDETNGIRILESTPGFSTFAFAINDQGQVLGGDLGRGSVLWDLNAGTSTVIPGGRALNNAGQVVGGATIWDKANGVRLLADLIPPELGWEIENAFAINDAGQVVGYGLRNERAYGFLMTPVPEPSVLSLLLVVGLVLLGAAKRSAPCRPSGT